MSLRNSSHAFNWRSHPHPSPVQDEQEQERANSHPQAQRWSDAEPLAYVDGLNLYQFCADNPIHAVNPLGM